MSTDSKENLKKAAEKTGEREHTTLSSSYGTTAVDSPYTFNTYTISMNNTPGDGNKHNDHSLVPDTIYIFPDRLNGDTFITSEAKNNHRTDLDAAESKKE